MAELKINIPDYALEVMDRLQRAGEQVYIVGGSLRDALLGLPAHDYDMASSALPERCREIFADYRVIDTGLKHGTVTVLSHGHPIEITTFRIDGEYTDSRRPDSVSFTRSLESDLSRRDFTVNAMAYGHEVGLVDLFGGTEDLKNKIIRAVGNAEKRFSEDALRIMRAFRFAAQLGFSIEPSTLKGVYACREGLAHISRERICSELLRLICSKYPTEPLALMCEHDIMPYVLYNYTPSRKLIELLDKCKPGDYIRLGVLLFEAEPEQARKILNGLKCSNKQKTGVLAIMRGAGMCVSTPRDAVSLRAAVGEYAAEAARISELMGISPKGAASMVEESRVPTKISDLAIGGRELTALGFSGKELGGALDFLLSAVMDNPELNDREKLKTLALEKFKERS